MAPLGTDLFGTLEAAHCPALHRVLLLTCWSSSQIKRNSEGRIRIGCTTADSEGQDGGIVGEDIEEWLWRASEEAT